MLIVIFFITLSSQAQVVISQVFGGGGSTSSPTYKYDFIEIFNRGTAPQNLKDWSIQYSADVGTSSWKVTNLTDFTLQPGQYYLIKQNSSSTSNAPDLPAPDATGNINMSQGNGKVALVNSITALTGANPTSTSIIDLVGYGTTPNGYEGSGPTGTALTITTSFQRVDGGCTDTNSNPNDFAITTPAARNSASPFNVCPTAPASPSLTINSPANTAVFSPETTSVTVAMTVSNFNVANGTGDGHIHYTINGGGVVMKYDTAPIAIPTTPGNTYTVYMELVDNSHNPISPAVNKTVTFSVAAYNVVANLAELRADVIANGEGKYYQINSNPVVTYKRTTRNQKYIQDTTAAILIDDSAGILAGPIAIGDAVSTLKGKATLYFGTLELIPTSSASIASSGNTVVPQVVTAATISANLEAYESELVQINGVSFTTADGTATFTTSNSYILDDGSNITFRTLFSEADYIGQVIPSGPRNLVALVTDFNGAAQVTARAMSDVTLSTVGFDAIAGLQVHPNPVKDGNLFISSTSGLEKSVVVYDILGKQVLANNAVNNIFNVSSLNSGVYIIKITEEGKTATRKLVIK